MGLFDLFGMKKPDDEEGMEPTDASNILGGIQGALSGGPMEAGGLFGSIGPSALGLLAKHFMKKKPQNTMEN